VARYQNIEAFGKLKMFVQ